MSKKPFPISKTYCNPIPLPDYPVSPMCYMEDRPFMSPESILEHLPPTHAHFKEVFRGKLPWMKENDYRETADPTVIYYEGKWYLYPSCGMAFVTEDFVNWKFHRIEPYHLSYAPTVVEHKGKFYLTANSAPLHVADNPLGPFVKIGDFKLPNGEVLKANDPMLFSDDDGRLYFYWGMGPGIQGAELDASNPIQLITEPKTIIKFNPEHEWEHYGEVNQDWSASFIEGSWMVKVNGTYYLTYSAGGTEFSTYGIGAYKSKSPLDGFQYQQRNPISRDNTGMVRGPGHGSIVKGPNNTLWVFYTVLVGYENDLERRCGMDPAGIDENGDLYTLSASETPQWAPGLLPEPEKGNDTGLLNLTLKRPHEASSYVPGRRPLYALDDSMITWWQPAPEDKEKWLLVALQGEYLISAARIMWKEVGLDVKKGVVPGPFKYKIEAKDMDRGGEWITVVDMTNNEEDWFIDYRTFDEVRANFVRLTITGAPNGIEPGVVSFSIFGEHAAKP